MKKYKAVKSIKSLYYVANAICVAPIFDFTKNECRSSYLHKFYCVIMSVLVIVLTIYSFVGRILYTYNTMTITTIFMDGLSLIVTAITNIWMTVTLTMCKGAEFQRFVAALINFDCKSNIQLLTKPKFEYYKKIFLYHLFFVTFCVNDGFMWMKRTSFTEYRHYIIRYVQYYHLITFSFLIYNYVVLIRDRLMHLNDMLLNSVTLSHKLYVIQDFTSCNTSHSGSSSHKIEENCVKKITILYTSLCDIVQLFNEIFGSILVFMTITIVVGLLQPINIAFVYAKNDIAHTGGGIEIDLVVVCVFWAALFIICAVMIAVPCEQAKREGVKTSYLSYKLSQELALYNKQQTIKDDLFLLGQQAFQHYPSFNASGFYYIDHTLLSAIIAAVTSYLIVLIQLA